MQAVKKYLQTVGAVEKKNALFVKTKHLKVFELAEKHIAKYEETLNYLQRKNSVRAKVTNFNFSFSEPRLKEFDPWGIEYPLYFELPDEDKTFKFIHNYLVTHLKYVQAAAAAKQIQNSHR